MQTAEALLKALQPIIEQAVMRHAGDLSYGVEAVIRAHHARWNGELAQDPSGNHLRSEAAGSFLNGLGWTTHGYPQDESIQAFLVARYAIEYAMLVGGTSSWVSPEVAALLEPFRQ